LRHLSVVACLAVAMISACSSMKGRFDQDRYVAPDEAFSVALPDRHFRPSQESVFPSAVMVDFLADGNVASLPVFGLYTVEWLVLSRPMTKSDFESTSPRFLKENIAKRFASSAQFTLKDSAFGGDPNRPILQFIANGRYRGKPAFWEGTIIWFEDRIAIASYVAYTDTPLGDREPASASSLSGYFLGWARSLRRGK
jgi:hypothetical protein